MNAKVSLMLHGEEKGPFTVDQIHSMFDGGLITPDTMCKRKEDWNPLINVMGKTSQVSQPVGRYFLKVGSEERGPFTFQQVRNMWDTGSITADAMYKLAELWRPLSGEIFGLKPEKSSETAVSSAGVFDVSKWHSPTDGAPVPPLIQGVQAQIKTNFRSALWWILLLLCVAAMASTASRTGTPANAGVFSFFGPILGILVLRGWCKRRTLKVLRRKSWNTDEYFLRVYVVSVWGYVWRSFSVFLSIGLMLAILCSESPKETATFSTVGVAIWLLCVPFTLDVPYWIKRRLSSTQESSDLAPRHPPNHLPVEAKLAGVMNMVGAAVFPRGEADIAEGIENIQQVVRGKLTTEECRHVLTTTKYLLRTSRGHRSEAGIVPSILVRSNGKISRDEARRIYIALGGPDGPLYTGGDGVSGPVVINATSSAIGIPAEYDYLGDRFGKKDLNWTLVSRSHDEVGGREIETFTIRLRDGTSVAVRFDISAFYNKA